VLKLWLPLQIEELHHGCLAVATAVIIILGRQQPMFFSDPGRD